MNEKLLDIFDQAREEGYQEGYEEGYKESQTLILLKLVRDGSLPLPVAARHLGVSEEEFRRLLAEE